MTNPYARREADRVAYLVHRLKHPDAPPLRLPHWPADPELDTLARALRHELSAEAVAGLIAQFEETLRDLRARAGALRCRHCREPLTAPRRLYCGAPCEAAAIAENA